MASNTDNGGLEFFQVGVFVQYRDPLQAGGFVQGLIEKELAKHGNKTFCVTDFEMKGECHCGSGKRSTDHRGMCPIARANTNPQMLTLNGVPEPVSAWLYRLADADQVIQGSIPPPEHRQSQPTEQLPIAFPPVAPPVPASVPAPAVAVICKKPPPPVRRRPTPNVESPSIQSGSDGEPPDAA